MIGRILIKNQQCNAPIVLARWRKSLRINEKKIQCEATKSLGSHDQYRFPAVNLIFRVHN